MRERHPGYMVTVVPIVIGALGGGLQEAISKLMKLITKLELFIKTVSEMQKTILMDSDSILRNVMLGLIQGDEEEID